LWSACEKLQMASTATVVEPPTVGYSQATGMAIAQVVAVGVAVAGQLVEPDHAAGILVGKRRDGSFGATGT
jgi:hypothetical protein